MQMEAKAIGQNIDFVTFEKEENGKVVKIILHDSLEDVIHNKVSGVNYGYEIVSSDKEHSVVICTMWSDELSRKVIGIGESIPKTLDNEIAQNYPTLIATQRAFDRAAIRFLNLPGKVFSNMEISFIDDLLGDITETEQEKATPKTPVKTVGIVSSIVETEDVNNMATMEDDGFIVDDTKDEGFIVEDTPTIPEPPMNIDAESLPFDVEEKTDNSDVGDYIITMTGKYATAGKTIRQIYETDAGWVTWMAENFTPRTEIAEKDMEQIKKFVASVKN